MEFENYKYNDCGVCLNPTIFAKYDDNNVKYELSYSKTENGYVTGEYIMTGPPDYYGSCSGCWYNSSKTFNTEKEAKLHLVENLIEFLSKQKEGKTGIKESINSAKELRFSILYEQLTLF